MPERIVQNEAISQWRAIASPSTPRNKRTLSSESLRSATEPASVGDSFAKQIVRRFVRKFNASDERQKHFQAEQSFIPSPKVTFLIDTPENLVCQICQQASLHMGGAGSAECDDPDIPAILPCAHICCRECIEQWLEKHRSCPFCRQSMVHEGCGHRVAPRPITLDTIHSIPPTLAKGGKIGGSCHTCMEKDRKSIAVKRWMDLAERFKEARKQAEKSKSAEATENLRRAQETFETHVEHEYWTFTKLKQRQW
ncbi:hypothetical protein GGR57DRAFT_497081 [Xylariaceae sp. FL1272]|nr:hypothetical protein GGR57DRAFT_497081 [Xylariaceae sp. FL1272]